MTEKYSMCAHTIPDGILHDQELVDLSLNGAELVLSFKTHLFSDMKGNAFCERYKEFTKCHMKARICDASLCIAEISTAVNKQNAFTVRVLTISEFVRKAQEILCNAKEMSKNPWTYLYTYISPDIGSAQILLDISMKYKHKLYTMCRLEFNTQEIDFHWE